MVYSKTYNEPPVCEKEILRYCGAADDTLSLVRLCFNEAREHLKYRVCYQELDVKISGDMCDFGSFCLYSKDLAKNLGGCKRAVVFAATIGIEIDRLIAKYSRISPAKALIFQAIGTERAEALCDAFCNDIATQKSMILRPRFSAGYGDLPLESQKEVFSLLDCERKIGVTLNNSMLMSPSKSVTAFIGIEKEV